MTIRAGGALALAVLAVTGAACREESKPAAANPAASAGPASVSTPEPRMRSLKVSDGDGAPPAAQVEPAPNVNGPKAPIAQSEPAPTVNGPKAATTQFSSGAGNQQVLNVRSGSGAISQRQDGGGNTQILNVDANARSISQSQKGSGNFQSMNVGTTDNPPPPVPAATTK
jgi:hypothetical protein